jgi:hypothetical protein
MSAEYGSKMRSIALHSRFLPVPSGPYITIAVFILAPTCCTWNAHHLSTQSETGVRAVLVLAAEIAQQLEQLLARARLRLHLEAAEEVHRLLRVHACRSDRTPPARSTARRRLERAT